MTLETENEHDGSGHPHRTEAGIRTPIKKGQSNGSANGKPKRKQAPRRKTTTGKRSSTPGRAVERFRPDSVLTSSAERAARFLDAYSKCGVITVACEMSRTGRQSHYDRLARSPEYANAFAAAHEVAMDELEHAARTRAVHGVDEPVFYRGEVVGSIKRYSDTLLIFLLKHRRPEVFADRALVAVSAAQPRQDLSNVPAARLDKMREWIEEANGEARSR